MTPAEIVLRKVWRAAPPNLPPTDYRSLAIEIADGIEPGACAWVYGVTTGQAGEPPVVQTTRPWIVGLTGEFAVI